MWRNEPWKANHTVGGIPAVCRLSVTNARDRVLFVLMHRKGTPLPIAHAAASGLTQPKPDRWVHVLLVARQAVLATSGDLPTCTVATLQERPNDLTIARTVMANGDALVTSSFFHNGAKRAILRSQSAGDQTDDYSSKNKLHTINNLIPATADGLVQVLSDTQEGGVPDRATADDAPSPLPPGGKLADDLGFVGSTLPNGIHTRSTRKPKDGTLTDDQKADNQAIVRRRITIEHVISSIKRRRIIKDAIWLWTEGVLELVMEISCALHHIRVRSRA